MMVNWYQTCTKKMKKRTKAVIQGKVKQDETIFFLIEKIRAPDGTSNKAGK